MRVCVCIYEGVYIYVKTFNVLQVVEIPITGWYSIFFLWRKKESTVMIIEIMCFLCHYGDSFKCVNIKEKNSLKFHNRMP